MELCACNISSGKKLSCQAFQRKLDALNLSGVDIQGAAYRNVSLVCVQRKLQRLWITEKEINVFKHQVLEQEGRKQLLVGQTQVLTTQSSPRVFWSGSRDIWL